MPSNHSPWAPGPGRRFGLLCLASVLAQALQMVYGILEGDASALCAALHPYLTLCLAGVGPFLASKGGVPAMLAFFPPGLCFLLSPVYPSGAAFSCGMLALSLVCAVAGEEYAKRRRGKNGRGR